MFSRFQLAAEHPVQSKGRLADKKGYGKTGYMDPGRKPSAQALKPPVEVDGHVYEHPADLVPNLINPASATSEAFYRLIAEAGVGKRPKSVLAVSGNAMTAAGIAMALGHHGEKVCVLELGYSESLLKPLLQMGNDAGLSELFCEKADLEHLILQAKANRLLTNVYAIHQGQSKVDWLEQADGVKRLVRALSKKFHRVILSLPDLADSSRLTSLAAGLELDQCLVDCPGQPMPMMRQKLSPIANQGILQLIH